MIRLGNKMNQYGTMQKITDTLNGMGIKTTLVYGATPKQDREGMINNFRTGDAQVLVSNPNTLGESISLHQTVHDAVYFEYNFNLTFMYSRAIVLIVWDYQQINILGTTT